MDHKNKKKDPQSLSLLNAMKDFPYDVKANIKFRLRLSEGFIYSIQSTEQYISELLSREREFS